MGRNAHIAWTNFTAGELSGRLEGRFDLESYHSGCSELVNFTIHPHGGASRRPGLRYVAAAKNPDKKCRLIPFVWNKEQSYVLEFGNAYMRVFKDQGQVYSGSTPYEISSPYSESQLDGIKLAQSADVMYLTHPNVAPYKLTRTGHTAWSLATVSFTETPATWTGATWPSCVSFFEQRSVWAGTPDQPQTLWLSCAGDYENLTMGTEDDDAMAYTIASDQVNPIQWLAPHDVLVIGALGGIWTMGARSSLDPVTPNNVKIDRRSSHGASDVQGRIIAQAVIFVHRHSRQILEQAYSLAADAHMVRDLTLLAEHITKGGIIAMDWAQFPDATMWALKGDGVLLAGTYYPPEKVLAWSRQITSGGIESICVIPGADRDELWCVVRRSIGGLEKRYVELLENPELDSIQEAFFVDCGLSYSAATAADTFDGMEHLSGCTVQVLTDGAVHPPVLVTTGGTLQLERDANQVQAGLAYESTLTTMRAEVQTEDGLGQGRKQRVSKCSLRLHESLGAKVGPDETRLDEIPFRTTGDAMNRAVEPFSGDTEPRALRGGWKREAKVMVKQDLPLPLTLLAILAHIQVNDK
jgi:hypothetical protein